MKDIINANRQRIRTIIKRITGSYNEDLEQEVYIKTWKSLDNYKEKGKFSAWLNTLTANICRDYLKAKDTRIQRNCISDEDVVDNIASNSEQEESLNIKQRQKIILNAVDSLPRKMRKIVVLYEFEELTYEEIENLTGLPVGTIKSRLFNARKILKEKLKPLKGN